MNIPVAYLKALEALERKARTHTRGTSRSMVSSDPEGREFGEFTQGFDFSEELEAVNAARPKLPDPVDVLARLIEAHGRPSATVEEQRQASADWLSALSDANLLLAAHDKEEAK